MRADAINGIITSFFLNNFDHVKFSQIIVGLTLYGSVSVRQFLSFECSIQYSIQSNIQLNIESLSNTQYNIQLSIEPLPNT